MPNDTLKEGDRLYIPNDGWGNPVRAFDLEKREYTDALQLFEVTGTTASGYSLKPVWS